MKDIVFLICIFVTALMVILHIALLFGAPLGEFVMGGKHRILPAKMRIFNVIYGAFFVGLLLFTGAILLMQPLNSMKY